MKNLTTIFFSIIFIGNLSGQTIVLKKDPKAKVFDLKRIVIAGVTEDNIARIAFEKAMKQILKSYEIDAYKSIEIYPIFFTIPKKAEKEISALVKGIQAKGFDGFMITAVTGVDEYFGTYKIYHLETQIYTLIPKNPSLLWAMCLDIYDYQLATITVEEYVRAIVMQMTYEGILPINEKTKEFPIKHIDK